MITILVTITVLAVLFWALCELVSALAGVFFMILGTIVLVKLVKAILK